ncbi:30S ribosomal protein S27ae [Thermococci archaeon]|nr:MAG: 30S ribosomal protein S27ae [Thermococci archaeon]
MTKHKNVLVSKLYEIKDGKLIRKAKKCPRCGSFMAKHENRYSCGKCGYTEFTT